MEEYNDTIFFIMGGSLLGLLLTVLGFFLKRIVSDVKQNVDEIGKLKGRIGLAEMQQLNDIKRIEENTQLELKIMSGNVGELSKNVNRFVEILINKGMKDV